MEELDFNLYRRNELERRLNIMKAYPLDIAFVGVTGAGKSTTLNTIFGRKITKVGYGVSPETMDISSYKLNDFFRAWDTPGLGDGYEKDLVHQKKIVDLLLDTCKIGDKSYRLIDMCVVIIEGSNRDMGTTYTLLNDVVIPNIEKERIFILINQADVAMKGRHWDKKNNVPDVVLKKYLEEQSNSIVKRVKEATNISIKKPVYYSAYYKYNIKEVFDLIIDNIPKERRKI